MFEKLLSLLPYNPSLSQQVAFYTQRVRGEASVRRTGLIFLVLAFLVQFFAVLSPPQPTVADSTNDLIDGGFSTKSEAVRACKNNVKYYGDILANYGISCDDVNAATTETIKSTDHDKQLYSMGWNPVGSVNGDTGKPTNETPVNLVGLPRAVYWRYLWSWDTGAFSSYQVLRVVSSSTHRVFFIMYPCGNIVSIGIPPSIPPCPYNGNIFKTDSACVPPCPYNNNVPKNSDKCFKPCPYNKDISQDSSQCKPCTSAAGSSDTLACIQVSKTASDPTQGWTDANNQTAQPGDTIVYTLFAKNAGKAAVPSFLMQENLSDVLDYADVVSLDGGAIDNTTGEVSWPAAAIKPGATLSHQITVKVKNPVPQTPASVSDPGHFDLVMTNVYGNTINIHLPGSPIKTIESSSATLVNTGPGSSLLVAGAVVAVAGYFYGRARLLSRESALALRSNATATV